MKIINVINLTKYYGKHLVFDNVSLKINEDRVSYLMGKNGSGKTTFFKCLLNLEGYQGEFEFADKRKADVDNQIFVIFDDCPFYGNLTGYQNIDLFGIKSTKACLEMICQKYLPHDLLRRKFKNYSYGERKKLALIIVEILKPAYLFMDEISNGLDFESVKTLQKDIKDLSKTTCVILTGHHFEFYEKIVDDVYVIQDHTITKIPFNRNNNDSLEKIYNERYTETN